jgi:hypothetical protein
VGGIVTERAPAYVVVGFESNGGSNSETAWGLTREEGLDLLAYLRDMLGSPEIESVTDAAGMDAIRAAQVGHLVAVWPRDARGG